MCWLSCHVRAVFHSMIWRICTGGALFTLACGVAAQSCFEQASERHGIAPEVLRAIAQQESAMNSQAIHHNQDGSVDMGLMQINSRWLPSLSRHGIERHMLWDPCTNVDVGAWILAANFRRYGVNWNGLGAYNAGAPQLRIRYAQKIVARLRSHKPVACVPSTSNDSIC
jgi:soluble lytic murein transglycosylase-like protein